MSDTADREIAVSRRIDAPRNVVFEAYTTAAHLARWWGPHGFSITTHEFEFRPGGSWVFTMHGPDGTDYPNHIEWLEIETPARLVLRHGSSSEDPEAFISTITLEDTEQGTEVVLHSLFPTREQRDTAVEQFGAVEGAQQTLAELAEYVQSTTSREN